MQIKQYTTTTTKLIDDTLLVDNRGLNFVSLKLLLKHRAYKHC